MTDYRRLVRNTLWVCLTIVVVSIGMIWEADRYGKAIYEIGLTNAQANEAHAKADQARAQLDYYKAFPPGTLNRPQPEPPGPPPQPTPPNKL